MALLPKRLQQDQASRENKNQKNPEKHTELLVASNKCGLCESGQA